MRGPRKFCQRGYNFDIFFLVPHITLIEISRHGSYGDAMNKQGSLHAS